MESYDSMEQCWRIDTRRCTITSFPDGAMIVFMSKNNWYVQYQIICRKGENIVNSKGVKGNVYNHNISDESDFIYDIDSDPQ